MPTTDPVLQAIDLHKSYGHRSVLSGVEFELRPGELLGIIGENGAGKSTLLQILAGVLRADRGEVVHRGSLGYCPQRIVVNDDLTVGQHLRYFQSAYRMPDLTRAWQLLDRLALTPYRTIRAGALSGGTRQKLNLVLALMHDPDVVLMDEPYQGFDWENYLAFWQLAGQLRDEGRSVLVISHIAHDTERFDRLYRLEAGKVTAVRSELEVVAS
ncbi:ABC-type multidrug transport system ATPase subunit [Amycolatopsis bartoniae]|uniref:ABC transporter ATP-binding protein n=1 Tax=Amycolatopsis bartoniae TaxID=941986 RepID=A0A8H9M2T0_9PSEU|nr:ABC transporter ATP-binding protein [Amycolatopsis bartoniae]MBB2938192.1 ABC-type multidrug transport system ATPase subunit [Amycolatopsis bartoniae]TVT03207.1 ABC transporter ATP-binding protein [Amycolatopsis bartoniae]GHF33327.1 ABC transporter ATP-binding protein [Amycolatopsis bartoniae]